MKNLRKFLCIPLLLMLLTGCTAPKHVLESGNVGTTAANITKGSGMAAYRNGFVYFSTIDSLWEYDMDTGKTVKLIENTIMPISLHATDDSVFFEVFGEPRMKRITRDGKKRSVFFERDNDACGCCYFNGMDAYLMRANLYYRDLRTGEETLLLEHVNDFDVDDTYIYAVVANEKPFCLLRAPKDTLQFEKIELSFDPISVFACGEELFLCSSYEEADYAQTGLRYQIIRYADGQETPLPIYGYFYQVLDNHVIYISEIASEKSSLQAYNLDTGEIATLFESAAVFCVLDQRYIAIERGVGAEDWWLYDWQTGEISQML